MVRVTFRLELLSLVLILQHSASVSDQCSEFREEIDRVRKLSRRNELLVGQCYEQLKSESHISEAAFRSLKLAEDRFESKLQETEAVNSGLREQLDEFKVKLQELEAHNNILKKKVNESKFKLDQLETVNSGLKKQLETKESVLAANNEKQVQLQSTIDGLTKAAGSLNQTVQVLRRTHNNACRYLLEAAKSGDVNSSKVLFKCVNDNCTDNDKFRDTPLIHAARYGHVEVVRVLLEGGANVERADVDRRTALHVAAWNGHVEVCRLLLDWGAKVDPLEEWSETPLHEAAWRGHFSIVKLLVERGADVSLKNNSGQTASDLAGSNGKKAVAEWLDSVSRV